MATVWSRRTDSATEQGEAFEGGRALSTPRALAAVGAASVALGFLALALAGWLGWNRFGDHLSPLLFGAAVGVTVAVLAVRWETARRDATVYTVGVLLMAAVYLEAAYGDLTEWDEILANREEVAAWLRRNHRALSVGLVLLAGGIWVRRRAPVKRR